MHEILLDKSIVIYSCDELFEEVKDVCNRPKLQKYLTVDRTREILELLERTTIKHNILHYSKLSRDPKDNYLLDLCQKSNASFLVTGDTDLLDLAKFRKTNIVRYREFIHFYNELKQK